MIWSLWCEEKPTFCHHWNCRDFLIPLKGYLLTLNIILTRQSIRFTAMVTFGKYNYYFSKWVSISSNQTKQVRSASIKSFLVLFYTIFLAFFHVLVNLIKNWTKQMLKSFFVAVFLHNSHSSIFAIFLCFFFKFLKC